MRTPATLFLVAVLIAFGLCQNELKAQEAVGHANLPGFSVAPLFGNDWTIARPGGFPGLLGYVLMKKIPGWFPIGSSEIPVPLLEWEGFRRDKSGIDQIVFTKKLGNGMTAATVIRALWTALPPGDDILARTAQAREDELRKTYHVLKFEILKGDGVLPNCLRLDALFETSTDASKPTLISTRRYLCTHPDVANYVIDLGYGQQVIDGREPASLQEETRHFLQSLKFARLADLVVSPSVQVRLIPIGCSLSRVGVTGQVVWITAASNWLVGMDIEAGHPMGEVQFRRPVGAAIIAADAVWLAKNEIAMKVPETFSVDSLRFVDHFSREDEQDAVFAAGSIWTPGCASSNFGCYNKVSRIDPVNSVTTRLKIAGRVSSLAASNETLWVHKEGGVTRVDASSNTITADIPVPAKPDAKLIANSRALWIDDYATIWRIDAQTNQVTKINFHGPTQTCLTEETLWVLETGNWHKADGLSITKLSLHRFDPQTGAETGSDVSLETRSEESDSGGSHSLFLSQMQMRACRDKKIWLSDNSGVLLQLDLALLD